MSILFYTNLLSLLSVFFYETENLLHIMLGSSDSLLFIIYDFLCPPHREESHCRRTELSSHYVARVYIYYRGPYYIYAGMLCQSELK